MGLEIVDNSYFTTEARLEQYKEIKTNGKDNHRGSDSKKCRTIVGSDLGTVGCSGYGGNLAAATSTGGMSGKKWAG